MFPYAMPFKAAPSMQTRILRALQGRSIRSQTTLGAEVGILFREQREFNTALGELLRAGSVIETKNQIPGTGLQGPPVFEYTYRLGEK